MASRKEDRKPAVARPAAVSAAASLETLDAALQILHRFHRRHKNQHRVSTYWWPAFGQLRRHAGRLRDDLAGVAAAEGEKGGGKEGKKRSDKAKAPAMVPLSLPSSAAVAVARARHLQAETIPRAYFAFSRLVADRQFAPLGLLLLGVLAQVHSAVRSAAALMGEDPEGENEGGDGEEAKGSDHQTGDREEAKGSDHQTGDREEADDDLGEAVAREPWEAVLPESAGDDGDRLPSKAVGQAIPPAQPPRQQDLQKTNQKRKRDAVEELAWANGPHSPDESAVKAKKSKTDMEEKDKEKKSKRDIEEKDKAKKSKTDKEEKDKAKSKTDKEKKDKAKKRKRGGGDDEFDDLFAGLL